MTVKVPCVIILFWIPCVRSRCIEYTEHFMKNQDKIICLNSGQSSYQMIIFWWIQANPHSLIFSKTGLFLLLVIFVKGCVWYIFASLFCMSEREPMKQGKMFFLFHFKSPFGSRDNHIFTCQIFKSHDIIKWLSMKHQTHLTE